MENLETNLPILGTLPILGAQERKENIVRSVTYHKGDITADDADVLVATVNAVGVMGKGVAKAFKLAFPWIEPGYVRLCQEKALPAGSCFVEGLQDATGRSWAALVTKDHWYYPSKLSWVESGLKQLARQAKAIGAETIALPRPGCGNGKLDWVDVEPLVIEILSDFDLRIYGGQGVS